MRDRDLERLGSTDELGDLIGDLDRGSGLGGDDLDVLEAGSGALRSDSEALEDSLLIERGGRTAVSFGRSLREKKR
jgi:hypothetical protein